MMSFGWTLNTLMARSKQGEGGGVARGHGGEVLKVTRAGVMCRISKPCDDLCGGCVVCLVGKMAM